MADHYIAKTGNDATGDGTIGNPWLTADFALNPIVNGFAGPIKGDTYIFRVGTYKIKDLYLAAVSGTGPITVKPYAGEAVVFQMDATAADYMIRSNAGEQEVIFQSSDGTMAGTGTLKFSNNDGAGASKSFIKMYDSTLRLRGVELDFNGLAAPALGVIAINPEGAGAPMTFEMTRCKVRKVASGYVVLNQGSANYANSMTVSVNEFDTIANGIGLVFASATKPGLTMRNNTVVRAGGSFLYSAIDFSSVSVANNISYITGAASTGYFGNFGNTCAAQLAEAWAANNFVYRTSVSDPADFEFVNGNDYAIPMAKTNRYLNPTFTALGTGPADATLTLSNVPTNYVGGRGNASLLPSGGDINGAAWTAGDAGAYTNTGFSSPKAFPTMSGVSFFGDSIAGGTGGDPGSRCYEVFTALSGVTPTVDAIGGLNTQGGFWFADYVMINSHPAITIVEVGLGNFITGAISPANATAQTVADLINTTMGKIADYGSTPLRLGIGPSRGVNTAVDAFNAAVVVHCNSAGWRYDSIIDRMRFKSTWADPGVYYINLAVDLHPNNNGHLLIGSVAENLYRGRFKYWVAAANVAGLEAGTYQHPLTKTQIDSISALNGAISVEKNKILVEMFDFFGNSQLLYIVP